MRSQRYTVALLFAALYFLIVSIGIGLYWQLQPDWGLRLAPSGPAACSSTAPSPCFSTWMVRSAATDPAYLAGLHPGTQICGYDGQAVTLVTPAASINAAQRLQLMTMSGCTRTVSQTAVAVVPAVIDFATAILCAILAVLLFLHGTRRRLIALTVSFLSSLVLALSWYPISLTHAFLSTSEVIAASYGAIPLGALVFWYLLMAPDRLRWVKTFLLGSCGISGILAVFLSLAVITHDDALLGIIVSANPIVILCDFALTILIAVASFRSRDIDQRAAIGLLATAGIVAILPLLGILVVALLHGEPSLLGSDYSDVTVGALPLALAYLVLRRELVAVDSLVRQTARVIVHGAGALGGVCLITLLCLALPLVSPTQRIVIGAFLMGCVTVWLQRYLPRYTEAFFLPEVKKYREIALDLQNGTGTAEISQIAGELASVVQAALPVTTTALFVKAQDDDRFIADSEHSYAGADPLVVTLRQHPETVLLQQEPFQVIVPLLLDHQLIAFWALGPREDGFPYARHEYQWLLTLGRHRALAIDYARKITRERELSRKNALLSAVATACSSASAAAMVAEGALTALGTELAIPFGVVVIPDRERPGFARILAQHLHPSYRFLTAATQMFLARLREIPIASTADLDLLRTLAGTESDAGTCQLTLGPSTFASICLPMQFTDEVLGALYVTTAADTMLDRSLIATIADEVATSLHRAHLYEDAQRLAMFDPLTGLANHRALQETLRREVAIHAGQTLPVSLLILDIDLFRHFNETYGHDGGDHTLRAVARALQSVLRSEDTAARFGGEEFVVVLPNTDASRAHDMAERVRQVIAATPVVIADAAVSVTVSVGHATFPLHASAPSSLLKATDLALYNAKRTGRNRVCAYTPLLLDLEVNQDRVAMPADLPDIGLPSGADLEAVQALVAAIDLYDGYTASHSEGVSRYAVAIGTAMGVSAEEIEALRLGGLVHDVGKMGVPVHVLRKPGKLDADEWAMMQAHTVMGEKILRHMEHLRHLLPLVRSHHERLDGTGYPDGLRGAAISDLVRIMSVADVFDAFTAERPYHPGRSALAGLQLLHDEVQKGRMDARMVAAMERLLREQGRLDVVEQEQLDAA